MDDTPDFIPDDQFVPDKPSAAPEFIPDGEFKEDEKVSAKAAPDFIPNDKFVEDEPQDLETPGQQVFSGIEGVGKAITGGLGFPLAKAMRSGASKLGVPDEYLNYVAPSPEKMKLRSDINPVASSAGEIAGSIGLFSKLPQIGSKAINGMIQMGVLAGTDELSKALLGQGDPLPAAASRIAANGVLGLITGGVFGKIEKLGASGLKHLENKKMGGEVAGWLSGFAHASSFPESGVMSVRSSTLSAAERAGVTAKSFKKGQEDFFRAIDVLKAKQTVATTGASVAKFGTEGLLIGPILDKAVSKLTYPLASKANQKLISPALLKAMADGKINNLSHVIDHATQLSKGASKINYGVEGIFKGLEHKLIDEIVSDRERKRLEEYIENGGINEEIKEESQSHPQGFAKGGKVQPGVKQEDDVATIYPEQNILLSAAKARIPSYLNSIRPTKNIMKLPYDKEVTDRQKEKDYKAAVDLAIRPLNILNHVKRGTLLPKHMEAFTQMYPDLYRHLSNKVTAEMMKSQVKGSKKPPYKTRQALSLFLGSSLDSTLTPMGMQAAQAVFAQQKAQKSNQSSPSISKMDDSSRTPEQSREKRVNKV